MRKPIITLTLAYITGLLLGHEFLYFPYSIGFLIIFSILISGLLTWLDKLTIRRTMLVILPCLVGMAAYLSSAAWFPADHYTRHFRPDKETHEIIGKIISPLDRDPERTGFVVDIHDIDGTRVSGKVRVSVREEMSSVGYGDIIRITGKLFEPGGYNNPGGFDYPASLARSGMYYTVNVKSADDDRDPQPRHRSVQDHPGLAGTDPSIVSGVNLRGWICHPPGHGARRGRPAHRRAARPVHGGRRHAHHLHLRIPPRHGGGPLFRPDQVAAVHAAGTVLSPFDPAHGPKDHCRMAHPPARGLLYAACRGAGGNGPLARYDHRGALRDHPRPRECAHALPCPRSAPHPHLKPAGDLRHLVPAFVSLRPGHRLRRLALERAAINGRDPFPEDQEQRPAPHHHIPFHGSRHRTTCRVLLQPDLIRRHRLEPHHRPFCGYGGRSARTVFRDTLSLYSSPAAGRAGPDRSRRLYQRCLILFTAPLR